MCDCVSHMDLAEVYLRGRAQSTLAAYGSAYQDIMRYSNVLGKHWCHWGLGEVFAFFINGSKHLSNSIQKFLAVLVLFFGSCDKNSPAVGLLVTKVKVGVLKNLLLPRGHLGLSGRQRICLCLLLPCQNLREVS